MKNKRKYTLTKEEKEYAKKFSKDINLNDKRIVSQYGAKAKHEISKSNEQLKNQLIGLQAEFTKDVKVTESLIKSNEQLKKELEMYIYAGEKAIDRALIQTQTVLDFKDKIEELDLAYKSLENISNMVETIQTFHIQSLNMIEQQLELMKSFNDSQGSMDLLTQTSYTIHKYKQIDEEQQKLNESYLKKLNKVYKKL